ncbi:hypothetical protein CEXT_780371 [Caerostris extrusa]|uniref:Uncharacterized protein n=1 Tax=Caerostris extrusa TaxID=172846 RepID=A0AAV4RJR0_CAEEX|nr:hypothetical protein CEXT_780371 [Caerostris extrusa]
MAVNKKFEIFACNLFYTNWCDLITENEFVHLYDDEYLSVLDDWYCTALDCLCVIVLKMYREYIENTRSEYSSSISDLSSYIVNTCCREDLFGCLPLFDRIFFTGEFLTMLGDFCMERKIFTLEKLFRCVYLSWAMYLDRFSKQFYELGGWKQLKMVAASYRVPSQLIDDLHHRFLMLTVGFYELVKEFVEFFREHEPSVRYKGKETFDELWKIFCFKSFDKSIDNIREIENLEKFRQLPGILTNLKCLCDSDPSQLVDPMSECSESLHSVEKTEGVSHAAREVCQDTIPTPTDFQSSGPETSNSDHVLPSLLDPNLELSSALKNLQWNEVSGSCKDTSEVKLDNQKDIPKASKRNDPQYAKVSYVNLQHSVNKASGSDRNQAQQECSLKLSNLDPNNYGAALPPTTTEVSKEHLENVEQNLEDSKKMDDFCDGSSSKTPCLVDRSAASNSASAEHSASKYKEEQKKESESNDVQDMLRMLLVLGDREGIQNVSQTLQSSDNSMNKKRSKKRNRNRSKK